jgi:hypothetical protein
MVTMRNLAIALSAGLVGAVGCSDNGPVLPPVGDGAILLTWEVQDASGQRLSCNPGEQVHVTAGSLTDTFDCAGGSGQTDAIPEGVYDVRFDLVDVNNRVESTTMLRLNIVSRTITDAGHIVFQVAGAPGQATFTWEVRVNGSLATCASDETVDFDFGGGLMFQNINCATMAATLTDIPAGNYGVVAKLFKGGVTTPESQSSPINLTIVSGQTTDGGHVIFIVTM